MAERGLERPLADRLRPGTAADIRGQDHLLGPDKPLRAALESGRLHSMILWGPPGSGKTTLARVLAAAAHAHFRALSAVLAGVKEVREAVAAAQEQRAQHQRPTVLFVDEVHRFNKSQQDAFLPHVEDGTLTLVGATTENPSFALNSALLSRVRVYVLRPLTAEALSEIVDQALADVECGFGGMLTLVPEARLALLRAADGDARRVLMLLEIGADLAGNAADHRKTLTMDIVKQISAASMRRFDKGGDLFYDQISALHKSVRGSNPDAALYWLNRMLDGGCDPGYVARRIVRMASEDVGNADPRALGLALDAWTAWDRLGSPEGELALGHAVTYLACAPKSNAVYNAFAAARSDVENGGTLEVPIHLRNAPTRLARTLGHGKDYRYAHDEDNGFAAGVDYMPDELGNRLYYQPVKRGLEIKIGEKLAHLRQLDRAAKTKPDDESQ
jgi:putative ATPase